MLNAVEGHFVAGCADGGDPPDKRLELVPGAVEDARAFLADKAKTRGRLERVFELVDGFESQFGLELLATVHWVASVEKARKPDEVAGRTYAWNKRKEQFLATTDRAGAQRARGQGLASEAGRADGREVAGCRGRVGAAGKAPGRGADSGPGPSA